MPYDTPYNRMIADKRNKSNEAYTDLHAYSNQMYNGRGRFDEARVSFPERDGSSIHSYPLDYSGGITHKNLEGSGGSLGKMFNHLGMGEDARRMGMNRRLFNVPDMKGCGKSESEESESESEEEECDMKGDGFFGDVWSGIKNKAKELVSNPSELFDVGKQAYNLGKQGYDMYKGSKGKGVSGGAENMSLLINPFASPKEQSVFDNYAMTSGPIGSGISGGRGKKTSAWIEHVKAFCKAKGMKYRDALRSAECKSSYHKKGKGVSGGSVIGGPMNDPVNRGKITGGKKKKTGSALFVPQGNFPLTEKTSNESPMENASPDVTIKGGASTEFPQKYMKSTGHKWEGATLGAGVSDFPIITPKRIRGVRKQVGCGVKKIGANPSTYSKTPLLAKGKKKGGMLKQLMKSSSFSGGSKRKAEDEKPKTKEEEKVTFTKVAPLGLVKPIAKKKEEGKGRKKVGAVTPVDYPSNKNITGFGKKPKMAEILKNIMESRNVKMAEAKRIVKEAKMKGGSWYNDLWTGFKMPFEAVGKVLPLVKSITGLGKKGSDGRIKRAEVVKKVMKDKGLSMIEASKYVKTHKLYEHAKSIHSKGGHWYNTLWNGVKDVAKVAEPFAPLLL